MNITSSLTLNKGLTIRYDHLKEICLSEATEIAKSVSGRKNRSKEKHFEDALNGLMLQYAVAEYLISQDVKLEPSETLAADFVISNEIFIDVKGRFDKSSTCYTQSDWEHSAVKNSDMKLFYLCFDCRRGDGIAIFDGVISKEDISIKSNFSGWIMFANKLKNFELIIT